MNKDSYGKTWGNKTPGEIMRSNHARCARLSPKRVKDQTAYQKAKDRYEVTKVCLETVRLLNPA